MLPALKAEAWLDIPTIVISLLDLPFLGMFSFFCQQLNFSIGKFGKKSSLTLFSVISVLKFCTQSDPSIQNPMVFVFRSIGSKLIENHFDANSYLNSFLRAKIKWHFQFWPTFSAGETGFIFGFSASSILRIFLKFASMDLGIGNASAFQILSSLRSHRDVYAVCFCMRFFIIFGNLDSSQETSILAVLVVFGAF